MKKILIILFWFISLSISATNYCIKTGGNDALGGTSDATAWATISKVNSFWTAGSFAPGDQILFNRGNTFYGTIIPTESGTLANRITIGAYGTGADPVITGFTTITGWTNESGGIYSKVISPVSIPNMVTVDGVNTGKGRFPNTGWLIFESVTNPAYPSARTITDNELTNTPNWTGAQVVIRKQDFIIDVCQITNHTSSTITYTGGTYPYVGVPGYGYFIQNDLKCLTELGDWYYNNAATKLYMYFGAVDPTTKTVKVSTLDDLLYLMSDDYISVDNVRFEGANVEAVYIGASAYVTIENCTFEFMGNTAIYGFNSWSDNSGNLIIRNSIFNQIQNNGIYLGDENLNSLISSNTLTNIGEMAGAGGNSDGTYNGIIMWLPHGTIVEYNRLYNIGYIGISSQGSDILIRNNFIDTFCNVKGDGSGIYTQDSPWTGREITDNIVINGIGAAEGTYLNEDNAPGIYLDNNSEDILVRGNTIANCSYAGFFSNDPRNITITGNTIFNCERQLYIHNIVDHRVTGLDISNNIFFSQEIIQLCLYWVTSNDNADIIGFGHANYNYYARPINQGVDDLSIITQTGGWYGPHVDRNLASWQTLVTEDENSNICLAGAVDNVNKLHFIYNDSLTNKSFTLSAPMKDVTNANYSGDIVLMPYTSLILIGAGTVTESGIQPSVLVTSIVVTGAGGATTITTDNGTLQLSAAILPVDATVQTVTWSIADGTGHATINATGLVTAVTNGNVTARAMANDGSGVYGTLVIIITGDIPPSVNLIIRGNGKIVTSGGKILK